MGISTHILDTAAGHPAAGVPITLEFEASNGWHEIGSGTTDADGRVGGMIAQGNLVRVGNHRITFHVGDYLNNEGFYKEIPILFVVRDADQHYHVPLLLNPFGYSTYRGS